MTRTLRRGAVILLDVAFALPILACAWLALTRPALAYVDPSVMTHTIQALAGVAVALSAVLGVVWRRARRWLLRAMHVDENAGKAVEADVRAIDPDDVAVLAAAGEAVHSLSLPHKPFAPTLTWRGRLGLAPAAALALACCVLFVAPLEVILPGSSSLSFTLANVWLPLLVLAMLVGALIALAASATRGRAFDVILALIAALRVSTLLQEVVLNGNLPAADGTPVDWIIYDKVNLKSALAWFAVVAAFIALARLRPLASRVASVAACPLIVIAQSVGLGMLGAQYADTLARPVVTEEGLTTVSPRATPSCSSSTCSTQSVVHKPQKGPKKQHPGKKA